MESQNLVTETEQLLDGEDLSAEQIAHCVDQLTSEEIDAGLKKNFLMEKYTHICTKMYNY